MRELGYVWRNVKHIWQYLTRKVRKASIDDTPFQGRTATRRGYERRIEAAVESMHTQMLHVFGDGRKTVSAVKLGLYLKHLERVLYGFEGCNG